ncbi:DNA primase [Pseudomonadota bacterium]|nr:DNA primase [Pseudomonadota bacterium]
MSIPKSFIDQILDQTDIVDVVGRRVQLNKKGSNYWGVCPFHDDHKPSMAVNQDKQFYYCFVCQASGNSINFLRDYENLDFTDAVETLASSLGLEIPYEKTLIDLVDEDYSILDEAVKVFEANLKESKKAINYLKSRNISGTTAKKFQLGFSDVSWDSLYSTFEKRFEQKVIASSGLFLEKNKKNYDRFRNRVIFPIRNIKGQNIGFGGRVIDPDDEPKYLNSPETKLFNKSNELYGLYEARKETKKMDSIIVVEGYMDVIALHEKGIKNAVATLGTAVTSNHLSKLMRYSNYIFFAFDGDLAGEKAAWKALQNVLPIIREDTRIKFVFFEAGDDPDSYVNKHGEKGFIELINDGQTLSEFFFSKVKKVDDINSLEGRSKIASYASELIKKINNVPLREAFISEASKICEIPLEKLISKPNQPKPKPSSEVKVDQSSNTKQIASIYLIIHSVLTDRSLVQDPIFDEIREDSSISFLKELREVIEVESDTLVSKLIERIKSKTLKELFSQAMVSEIKIEQEDARKMFFDCMNSLLKNEEDREESLKTKYNTGSISETERRELQQLILKKSEIDNEDKILLKNLSLKKD